MLKWLDAKDEQAFGKSIAQFYSERVPFESPFSKKKFATKTQDTLKKIDLQIQQFRTTHPFERLQEGEAGQLVQVDASRRGLRHRIRR